MAVIPVLMVIGVIVALGFLGAFFWAIKSGQYDDTYSPSVRMLFEDKNESEQEEKPLKNE
ncbi:MAG: cbb3-type cytochrome oxidase assembly protein CcoS [Cytophagales bacterium]|nr:cbb3-type cytochrome oxidase assembly protein CcoS [Cytophagales bacterium]